MKGEVSEREVLIKVGPRSETHSHENMKGVVSERVVLTKSCTLVRNSFTWKYEGKGFRDSGLREELYPGQKLIYMEV